ncbi:sodium channel subunit beta-1-like [Lepisosteus oculatus]|uniref:sodium channel subunit beta-1-like n=1 Tax=Lepisosteus oculatus TaxID=7918 RepID=UPI003721462C
MLRGPRLSVLMCLALYVSQGWCGCVEVDSRTEAVTGHGFKLGCISCKRRGEVAASAYVEWYFQAKGESDFVQIYEYRDQTPAILHEQFLERLAWNGSKRTDDLQDGSLYILNVTLNDTGTYRCHFYRTLFLHIQEHHTNATKLVQLSVVEEANRELTSIISEVFMYLCIVGFQVGIVLVLVLCYKKTAAAARESEREKEPLDSKDNCAGIQVDE